MNGCAYKAKAEKYPHVSHVPHLTGGRWRVEGNVPGRGTNLRGRLTILRRPLRVLRRPLRVLRRPLRNLGGRLLLFSRTSHLVPRTSKKTPPPLAPLKFRCGRCGTCGWFGVFSLLIRTFGFAEGRMHLGNERNMEFFFAFRSIFTTFAPNFVRG